MDHAQESDTDSTKDTPCDPFVQKPRLQIFNNISTIYEKSKSIERTQIDIANTNTKGDDGDEDKTPSLKFVQFNFEESEKSSHDDKLDPCEERDVNPELYYPGQNKFYQEPEFELTLYKCEMPIEDPASTNTSQTSSGLDHIKRNSHKTFLDRIRSLKLLF